MVAIRIISVTLALGLSVFARDTQELQRVAQAALHEVQPNGSGFHLENPENQLKASFAQGGISVTHACSSFGLRMEGYGGRGHLLKPVDAAPSANGSRVEYRRGDLVEWYINESRGLEQGFTLLKRPAFADSGSLTLEMSVTGDLTPVLAGKDISLQRDGHEVLRYAGLRAWDTDGKELPARMEVEGRHVRLQVDDNGAKYPVTVDPFILQQKIRGLGREAEAAPVAISGETLIVGGTGSVEGAAYIYVRTGGTWVLQQMIGNPAGSNRPFDSNVALNGNTAIVNGFVFFRSGSTWSLQDTLSRDGTTALDGDTAIVAGYDGASVYVRQNAKWSLQQLLPLASGVSLSGNTAILRVSDAASIFVRLGSAS